MPYLFAGSEVRFTVRLSDGADISNKWVAIGFGLERRMVSVL